MMRKVVPLLAAMVATATFAAPSSAPLATTLVAQAAAATAATDPLADCNGAAPFDVLRAPTATGLATDALPAQAVFLDRQRIRWPGAALPGVFRLHHAADARLDVTPGAPVSGGDDAFTLAQNATDAQPAALAARFRHVAAGVDLALPDTAIAALPRLLRGQLVLAREDAQGRVQAATRLQVAGALDDLYATAAEVTDLGVRLPDAPRTTRIRLWAPTARRVAACVYPDADGPALLRLDFARDDDTGVWTARHPADLGGRTARLLVDVLVPGHGLVRQRVTDPYAISLTTDGRRFLIGDLDDPAMKPAGWDGAPRPAPAAAAVDQVIYELHVRDFSVGDATVPAAHRGRYLAFTHRDGAGMRHLARLAHAGLTDVHLLPVFDLASVPESGCVPGPARPVPGAPPDDPSLQAEVARIAAVDCFNWGYDPVHYGAPEGSFATRADDPAVRVREFRAMVMALHATGLRVGMDVVYNHTSAAGQHPQSVLDRIVPGYYHRLEADGRIARSTCCENTATEHAMMAKLMIDTAMRWARDYRIDAFRFDLMGHQPRAAMEALQRAVDAAAGRRIPLLGEGWNFGEVADGARFVQASQLSLHGSGIATFSDRGRDAIRGGSAGDRGAALQERLGWVNGLGVLHDAGARPTAREALLRAADHVRVALSGTLRDLPIEDAQGRRVTTGRIDYNGQPAGYAAAPGEVVNYVENHDNHTLFDLLALRLPPATPRAQRARVQLLALALPALSQGVAYFHAGGELLRSKSLDRNSYDSGDAFNRLDWTLRDNGFGAGLPPAGDNRDDWPWLAPRLRDARIKPTAAEIRWTRDAFCDLLRIRASSTMFRLRTADDVARRLSFLDTGPAQVGTLVGVRIDGRGLAGARFAEAVVLMNADVAPRTLAAPTLKGRRLALHPVHRAPEAADRLAASARWDAANGRFTVPARTAVVFVGAPLPESTGPAADAFAAALVHDSRDLAYKAPFGAVPAGTPVRFALDTPSGAQRVTLVVERRTLEGNQERIAYDETARLPMRRAARVGAAGGGARWSATWPGGTPAVYGWWFEVAAGGRTWIVQNNDTPVPWTRERGTNGRGMAVALATGGAGATDPAAARAAIRRFRMTVHAPDYTVPAYAADLVWYSLFPDRFRNGDPSNDPLPGRDTYQDRSVERHARWLERPFRPGTGDGSDATYNNDFFGGDLDGIVAKLDDIAALGANALYLTPIFRAASNHKYDTADWLQVDPAFGGDAAFDRLVAAAGRRGIRVVVDTSLNHVGSDSRYFDRYGKYGGTGAWFRGEPNATSPYAGWFVFDPAQADPDKRYRSWLGIADLPELDKGSAGYRTFAFGSPGGVMQHWLDRGAAGWRMDVAPWVPDDFWRAWRRAVKSHRPDALTLAETWFDSSKYFLGDTFDATMNYVFRDAVLAFAKGADAGAAYAALEATREWYPAQALHANMNLVSSHDPPRALHVLGHVDGVDDVTIARARQRLRLAVLFQMTWPGAPSIYYGDEVGVTGGDDPYNRAPYPWPDLGGAPDLALREDVRQLIALRHAHPVLRRGRLAAPLHTDAQVLVLLRQLEDTWAVVALNNGDAPREVTVRLPAEARAAALRPVLEGAAPARSGADGTLRLAVPARFGTVLVGR